MDGRQVNIWQDRMKLSRVCAEIEKDYGLTVVDGRVGKGMPGLSRAELERTAREQWAEPPRITLARLVSEVSVASKDEAVDPVLIAPVRLLLPTEVPDPRRSGLAEGSWPKT